MPQTQTDAFLRFATQSGVAQTIAHHYVESAGSPKEILLEDIENWPDIKNLSVSRPDILKVMGKMNGFGVADYIVGRHGRKTRLVWKVGPEDLIADNQEVSTSLTEVVPQSTGSSISASQSPDSALLTHNYVLRPSLIIPISLPEDLTRTEAKRLAAFIQTLTFDFEG